MNKVLRCLSVAEREKLAQVLTAMPKKDLTSLFEANMEEGDRLLSRERLYKIAEGKHGGPDTIRLIRRVLLRVSDSQLRQTLGYLYE